MSEREPGFIRKHPLGSIFAGTIAVTVSACLYGTFGGAPIEHASTDRVTQDTGPAPAGTMVGASAPTAPGAKPDGRYSCNKLKLSRSGANMVITAEMSSGSHADTRQLEYKVDNESGDDLSGQAPNHDLSVQVPLPSGRLYAVEGHVTYSQGGATFQTVCPTLHAPRVPQ